MASRFETIVEEFEALLDTPTVKVMVGRKNLPRHGKPPRIVFYRAQGNAGANRSINGTKKDTETGIAYRILLGREAGYAAQIWGATDEDTENLLHLTLRHLLKVCDESIRFGSEDWISEEEGAAGDTVKGEKVVLNFVIGHPVTDQDLILTTLDEDEPFVNGLEFDGHQLQPTLPITIQTLEFNIVPQTPSIVIT